MARVAVGVVNDVSDRSACDARRLSDLSPSSPAGRKVFAQEVQFGSHADKVSTSVLIQSSTNVLPVADTLDRMDQPKPSDIFSANLIKVLEHQTLTVNAAANAWKVPQKTLESFVKKGRVPSIDTADRVAEAAGYQLWQMLQAHFDPGNPPLMQPVTPEEEAFHAALKALIKKHPQAIR